MALGAGDRAPEAEEREPGSGGGADSADAAGRPHDGDQCDGDQHRTASPPHGAAAATTPRTQPVIEPFRAVTGAVAIAARVMMRSMRGMFELLEVA